MIEEVLNRLRNFGFKLTDARRAVLEVFCSADVHLTSAEIVSRVEQIDSKIGRASIFRTLELLTGLAIIRPSFTQNIAIPTYVLLAENGHHSHIICTNCHAVLELEECEVDHLKDDLENRYNITLSGHMLELYGICQDCLNLPPVRADI
jgi:Fur family ferric uptake transcriptional regulator